MTLSRYSARPVWNALTSRNRLLRWIALTEDYTATGTLEKRLWGAADQLRVNSGLKPQEYSGPTLGLIFLRFAERVRRRRPHGYELCSKCVRP